VIAAIADFQGPAKRLILRYGRPPFVLRTNPTRRRHIALSYPSSRRASAVPAKRVVSRNCRQRQITDEAAAVTSVSGLPKDAGVQCRAGSRRAETGCAAATGNSGQSPLWVKTGKAQREQMFSALPLKADIAEHGRHVRLVPKPEVASSLRRHWRGKKTAGFQTNVPVHPGARRSRRGRRGSAVNQNENGRNTLVKVKC
jgi:hypothetical protein